MQTRAIGGVQKVLGSRQFFTVWFGLGIPPFLIGTVVVAYRAGWPFGTMTLSIVIAWLIETFMTVCRRCPFYGGGKCGIPSLVAPLMLKKVSAMRISTRRIWIHYYADLAMILFVNYVYWRTSHLFSVVLICSFVGWLVVFRRKKFHGLLFRLTTSNDPQCGHRRLPDEPRYTKLTISAQRK